MSSSSYCFPSITQRYSSLIVKLLLGAGFLLLTQISFADLTLCAYNPANIYSSILKEYVAFSQEHNVSINYTTNNNEEDIVSRYESGLCDIMAITGIRARNFNSFTGSLDSLGSIPDYQHLKTALQLLSTEQASKYLSTETSSIAGILPLGNAYFWSRDLSDGFDIDALDGKSIAVLEHDFAQQHAASSLGLNVVPVDIQNYADAFNEGKVDYIISPTVGFDAMNIREGVGTTGGHSSIVIGQLTYQFVAKRSTLTPDFLSASREFMYDKWKNAMQIISQLEQGIPSDMIYMMDNEQKESYQQILTQIQSELVDSGYYNNKTMNLLKKIRCRYNKQLIECR